MKAFTARLEEMELVDRNPFRRVRKPKVEKVEMQILSADEVKRLLSVFDQQKPDEFRDYVLVKLVLATGLRRGEVIRATVDDLDVKGRSLVVHGKGRKQRRVPLPAEVCTLLWTYQKKVRVRYARTPHLFVNLRGGPLDPGEVSHRFRVYVHRAGIVRRSTLHGLRHWAASNMLINSMPMEMVSRTLGHADSSITSRVYAHVGFGDIQRAYDNATR